MKRDLGKHFKIVAVSFLAAISVAVGQDGNHHRIYPFDVTIAGEVAVLQGSGDAAIFARTRKVVKNDVEVKLDIEPTMIIVNVFPVDKNGTPTADAQEQVKIIMVTKGTAFKLADTKDKTMQPASLEPGMYLMNIVAASKTARVAFEIGAGKAKTEPGKMEKVAASLTAVDQSKPENVLQAIFDAANSGNIAPLISLKSSDPDGDVKDVCSVGKASAEKQAEFKSYFMKGKISGAPKIEGNKAAINFTFGPSGTKSETMNLVKEGDQWFLDSF